jgi:CRISPR/Cas system-associated protein Csm6
MAKGTVKARASKNCKLSGEVFRDYMIRSGSARSSPIAARSKAAGPNLRVIEAADDLIKRARCSRCLHQ